MVSSGDETGVQLFPSTHVSAGQSEWIERCRTSILERDPLLSADDVLDLALTLWDRPSCQRVPPELAARLLFSGELNLASLQKLQDRPLPLRLSSSCRRVATQRAGLALRARDRPSGAAGAGEARSGHRSPDDFIFESDRREIALAAFFSMAWRTLLHRGARQSARLQPHGSVDFEDTRPSVHDGV
jgi:hypothetical protein